MTKNENANPSPETLLEINRGVNFVNNWLSERYAAGKITEQEYNQAMEKIAKVKIFPTSRGTDRLIDAYETGELKLSEAYTNKGLTVEDLKKGLLQQDSYANELRGLSTYWSDTPAILIDIEKIKAESGERSDLSSVVAHELTHCVGLKDTSEREVKNILYGKYKQTTPLNASVKESTASCSVQVIPDTGTNSYVHGNKKMERSEQHPNGLQLNENVLYDPYEDKENEVYARIMQMRYDMNLDSQKNYTPEDIKKMRQSLFEKQIEGKLSGADQDIKNRIFKRYSDEQISHFLNDTAQIQPNEENDTNYLANIKQIMQNDSERYLNTMNNLNHQALSASIPEPKKKSASYESDNNLSLGILRHKQNEYG